MPTRLGKVHYRKAASYVATYLCTTSETNVQPTSVAMTASGRMRVQ